MKKKNRIRKAPARAEPVNTQGARPDAGVKKDAEFKKDDQFDNFKNETVKTEKNSRILSEQRRAIRKKQVTAFAKNEKKKADMLADQGAQDAVFRSDAISFKDNIEPGNDDRKAQRKAAEKKRAVKVFSRSADRGEGERILSESNAHEINFDKGIGGDDIPEAASDGIAAQMETLKEIKEEMSSPEGKLRRIRKHQKQGVYELKKTVDENGNESHELILRKTGQFNKKRAIKNALRAAGDMAGSNDSERDDNDAVSAAGFSLRSADLADDFVTDAGGRIDGIRIDAVNNRRINKQVDTLYKEYPKDNPGADKHFMQKRLQKKKIKREYVKALKKSGAKAGKAEAAKKASDFTTKVASKIREIIRVKSSVLIAIVLALILVLMIMTSVSSCGAMMGGGLSTTMAGSYQSEPAELDNADAAMTRREMDLQTEIDNIETDHPDYDEYNYNLGEIGHDPFVLINYLSAKNIVFTAADVDAQIEELFNEMYTLTLEERQETRTRTVTNDEGEEEEEEYTVDILDVTLMVRPLEEVVRDHMNAGEAGLYEVFGQTKGALQQFYTPLDLDWMGYISSYYGYRIDVETGTEQFHRGLDISVPEGTLVYASISGVVTEVGYDEHYGNFIVIKDDNGYEVRYAHLESVSVSEGQSVRHGQVIGKTGMSGTATGSKLHFECLYNGEYFNPLFYFEDGDGSIYGDTGYEAPASGDVTALIAEAERYLDMPYVWGGSSPATGFDCSGFVSYVLANSGFYDTPRCTAQGLFNKCVPVSPSEARAGDLIFFTGTYNSGNPVSHVGIYTGNGMMIHCGDPIKYTSVNTPYWQEHFYSYGRLPRGE